MGTPEVEGKPQVGTGMGELAELSGVELLACVGISGESLDLRGDCLSPCGQGQGSQSEYTNGLYIHSWSRPGPSSHPPAELQEVWEWPLRRPK